MIYYRAHTEGIGTVAQLDLFDNNLTQKTTPPERTDAPQELFYQVKSAKEIEHIKHSYKYMPADYKQDAIDILYEEQSGICNGCDAYMRKVDLTLDHIHPKDKGGTDDIDNLQLLCYRCNNWKRTKTMVELIDKLYNENIIPAGIYKKQIKRYKEGKVY